MMQLKYKISFLAIFLMSASLFSNENLEIYTSSGIVKGSITNKVISWDDIPYAEPPVDELRWKAPRDYQNNRNVIRPKNDNFCVQEPSTLGGAEGMTQLWVLKIVYI